MHADTVVMLQKAIHFNLPLTKTRELRRRPGCVRPMMKAGDKGAVERGAEAGDAVKAKVSEVTVSG